MGSGRGRVYVRGTTWYLDFHDPVKGRQRLATTAKTKGEAKALLNEKTASFSRQALGLEAAPQESSTTLWELCQWWLDNACPAPSKKVERARLGAHVQRTELGELTLPEATPEKLEIYFKKMERPSKPEGAPAVETPAVPGAPVGPKRRRSRPDGASPASVNKLRSILHAIFEAARKPTTAAAIRWTGRNPVEDTEARTVMKRKYPTIAFEEVQPLLACVPEYWLPFFAMGIFMGLRKGEVCGLLKTKVDLRLKEIEISASYTNQTTKGKHWDTLPIIPVLMPYVEAAMATSRSEYLFPALDGKSMRSRYVNPEKILRTALKKAGLIEGWRHYCPRCGFDRKPHPQDPNRAMVKSKFPKFSELHADGNLRRCPQCDMKLSPRALPRGAKGKSRGMRFHDLRHSLATILIRSGAEMHHVQRILRHANIETTASTYTHLQTEDLRGVLNIFGGKPGGKEERLLPTAAVPHGGAQEVPCPHCAGTGKIQGTNPAQASAATTK